MRTGPAIHGALLIVALLFAYKTWTRDKTEEPKAGEYVGRTDLGLDDFGDLLEKRVTGGMTEGVVDNLELIEIDIQQRVRLLGVALDNVECGHQPVLELTPVQQAGQCVVRGLVAQLAEQAGLT